MRTMARSLVALGAAALLTLGVAAPAHAGGSDAPPPYTVDSSGIALPNGDTFPTHGHVNLTTSQGGKGIHFDPNNGHPGGAWIGESFIPWSAFSLTDCDTVSWVQIHGYNEHYGEGGQSPVTVGACAPVPEPEPAPEPEPEPDIPTVGVWTLTGTATCDALTFSHDTFVHRDDPEGRASTSPEYRVDVNGVIGDRIPYTWGETITVEAPDAQADTVWEVRIFAYTPMFQFTQQIGSHKFFSNDCAPPVIPEKPEPLTGVDTRTSDPVCTEPLDGTATVVTEELAWTHHHRLVDGEWVLAPNRFETMWTVSGVETIDLDDCAPAEEPPVKPEEPEEPVTPPAPPAPPAADRLPSTGADPTPFGLAGLTLLVAGGAAIGVRKIARHL